jgi:hypothetical protein
MKVTHRRQETEIIVEVTQEDLPQMLEGAPMDAISTNPSPPPPDPLAKLAIDTIKGLVKGTS